MFGFSPELNNPNGAIVGGVAAGAALLFATPAIIFVYWHRRRSRDIFFDVPGLSLLQKIHFYLFLACKSPWLLFMQRKKIQRSTWGS